MANTCLDFLVEYPATAMQRIGGSQDVVELLTNVPGVDMDGDTAAQVFDNNIFDYGYVPSTVDEASAFVCVEANMIKAPTPSMQNIRVYVTIMCHKSFMQIEPSKFKGMVGNRRDNLSRLVDNLLNGSDAFGLGQLKLESAIVVPAPTGFSARELTYSISDFKKRVGVGR